MCVCVCVCVWVCVCVRILTSTQMAAAVERIERQYGPDFIAELRPADDWLFEALLQMPEDPTKLPGIAAFAAVHAAMMTHQTHGLAFTQLKVDVLPADNAEQLFFGLLPQFQEKMNILEEVNAQIGWARQTTLPRGTHRDALGVARLI